MVGLEMFLHILSLSIISFIKMLFCNIKDDGIFTFLANFITLQRLTINNANINKEGAQNGYNKRTRNQQYS